MIFGSREILEHYLVTIEIERIGIEVRLESCLLDEHSYPTFSF